MRLFEARTILEDLAIIARLKRLGVRGDSVFHRDDGETSAEQIQEVTSGGALRLCALDSLILPTGRSTPRRTVRDHVRDLDLARTHFDLLLRADDMNETERGALLGRIAKMVPEVADGLDAVKGYSVLNAITAEDINEIVTKHRALMSDYGAVAEAIKREAERLGARHRFLLQLVATVRAIDRLLEQNVLFGAKPLHGQRVYQDWVDNVAAANRKMEATKLRLEQLATTHVWAAG